MDVSEVNPSNLCKERKNTFLKNKTLFSEAKPVPCRAIKTVCSPLPRVQIWAVQMTGIVTVSVISHKVRKPFIKFRLSQSINGLFVCYSFHLEWMSSRLGSSLRDKGTHQKSKNMWTTSFGHSIRRNQHRINLRSRLGSAASFVLNQLQKYNIRDICHYTSRLLAYPFQKDVSQTIKHVYKQCTVKFHF